MKLTRNQIEAWLRQAECTDWGADMSTDDQVDVLRVAIRAFDAEEEIARVTAERDEAIAIYSVSDHQRDEACRDRDRAMAERDAARADIARMTRALADARAAVAIAHKRIAEVTAERDARPEISREMARRYAEWRDGFSPHPANVDRLEPVDDALRAHAAGSGAAEASGGVCQACTIYGPRPTCPACKGTGRRVGE